MDTKSSYGRFIYSRRADMKKVLLLLGMVGFLVPGVYAKESVEVEGLVEVAKNFREDFEKKIDLSGLRDVLTNIVKYRVYLSMIIEKSLDFGISKADRKKLRGLDSTLNQIYQKYAIAGFPSTFDRDKLAQEIRKDTYLDFMLEIEGSLNESIIKKEAKKLNTLLKASGENVGRFEALFNQLKEKLKELSDKVNELEAEVETTKGDAKKKNQHKIEQLKEHLDRYHVGTFYPHGDD